MAYKGTTGRSMTVEYRQRYVWGACPECGAEEGARCISLRSFNDFPPSKAHAARPLLRGPRPRAPRKPRRPTRNDSAPVPPKPVVQRAEFDGLCALCRTPIAAGIHDIVHRKFEGWVHETCPPIA